MITFQEMTEKLLRFWKEKGCIIHQGYDLEVGAGTFNPATFLRCLGPEPYNTAYIEPSRRPKDGRYGENPNRTQHYYQCQVILKPSPSDIQELYLQSLEALGFNLKNHDIRFVHDDWESPTLGAWGLGWEVWMDGMEVTQFTYFQSVGGVPLSPITGEITYGMERLAIYLQKVDSFFDLQWNETMSYGDIYHRNEIEWSRYNFELASKEMWFRHFEDYENEANRLMDAELPLPAYDFVMKASHAFNMLDARGVISVTERQGYITRIRNLSCRIAESYVKSREELGFPLLEKNEKIALPTAPSLPEKIDFNPENCRDLLLEIGSEELPATFVPIGCTNLQKATEQLLKKEKISHGKVNIFGTPRRLAILVENLSEGKGEEKQERRGPPLSTAFDANGKTTKAGEGFFRSVGIEAPTLAEVEGGNFPSIEIREHKKVNYLFAMVTIPGKSTLKLLSEELPKLILSIDFPKQMRWGTLDISYARPLRWIVALFGEEVIPFAVGDLLSSNQSSGHPQLCPGPITISNSQDYLDKLREKKVMVDIAERRQSIEEQLQAIEKENALQILEEDRQQVLSQVLHLVEWPMLTLADYNVEFLKAPREVLVSEMVEHQKYFPVSNDKGELVNKFVITANNTPSDQIRLGNLKVISARLADGLFLFSQDLKTPLETFNEKLKQVTFQKSLGSMYDKVQRLIHNSEVIHKILPIEDLETVKRAALLCKADLASEVVGEFPNLQGVMGEIYAKKQEESKAVATAINEHWMPRGEKAPLPESSAGIIVSIAEKVDNLLCCFAVGMKPTSSSDPYALRRQVLGIIKILIARKQRLPLMQLFENSFPFFISSIPEASRKEILEKKETTLKELREFITNRIKTVFQEYGLRRDEIEASLSSGFEDIYDSYCRAEALHQFRDSGEDFILLYEVFKRAKGQISNKKREVFKAELLQEEAEKQLSERLSSVEKNLDNAIAKYSYDRAYKEIASLQPCLAILFDDVHILAEDEAIRNNRIALLQKVFDQFAKLLDFEKIQEKVNHKQLS